MVKSLLKSPKQLFKSTLYRASSQNEILSRKIHLILNTICSREYNHFFSTELVSLATGQEKCLQHKGKSNEVEQNFVRRSWWLEKIDMPLLSATAVGVALVFESSNFSSLLASCPPQPILVSPYEKRTRTSRMLCHCLSPVLLPLHNIRQCFD